MFTWRGAIVLGIGFIVVGVSYLLLQGSGEWMDRSGAVLLIVLGAAMAFTFTILLRGSREL
jgi:dipeptide/tripeptide permease